MVKIQVEVSARHFLIDTLVAIVLGAIFAGAVAFSYMGGYIDGMEHMAKYKKRPAPCSHETGK